MKLSKKTTSTNVRRHGRRGFTLVELIVVLTIMAILAAIGVTSIISYINRSRFDKNSQNAITVYQAAQTAISQKISNGSIESWVLGIDESIASDPDLDIPTGAETNYSRHKSFALTFNPTPSNSERGQYLHEFLMPYFYDQVIFKGTITVVFDISATNNNGYTSYSASVLSVYYSSENTASEGWDDVCRNKEDGYPNGDLPDTNGEYRYRTSFVGFFNGTEESIRPVVSPVFIPWTSTSDMEGHIMGPSEDPEASGYLFNLRNGETLDVSWAIFDDDGLGPNNLGHPDHDEKLIINFYEYSSSSASEIITPSSVSNPLVTMTVDFSGNKTSPVAFSEATAQVTYERCDNWVIKRETCYGFITVNVVFPDGSDEDLSFPMSVTRVSNDGRTGTPRMPGTSEDERRAAPYYEYAISLDCLMERANDSNTENRQYGVYRLFGETPRNIFACISGTYTHYVLGDDGSSSAVPNTSMPKTFAARSMNDLAYITGSEIVNGCLGYGYSVVDGKGKYDGDDDRSNESYVITGTGVVNTFFGDTVYRQENDLQTGGTTKIGGTTWTDASSDAVISSFRHLSNIRWFTGYTQPTDGTSDPRHIDFRIVSNLDWYSHSNVLVDGVYTDLYASQVRVFSSNTNNRQFFSPVKTSKNNTNGTLYIVSFPALPRIADYMTLSSVSVSGGNIYSINNVQMRTKSFNDKHDTGYGLICENDGTVYNIYTNNLNLIFMNVANGSSVDYASVNKGTVTINSSGTKPIVSRAIGGLVGYNLGSVGLGGEGVDISETQNMIVMNNPVIICGQINGTTWTLGGYDWGTGAVIGCNGGVLNTSNGSYTGQSTANANSSTYGVFEVNGTFAIVAKKNAGGIIGRSHSNIGARLVINDPNIRVPSPEITLPKESNMPQLQNNASGMSCIVTAMNDVGGVIGRIQDAGFTYTVTNQFNSANVSSDPESGVNFNIAGLTGSDYGIDINLPANSLVFEYAGGDDNTAAGGAIGNMINCSGDYLSIRVNNSGHVYITRTDKKMYSGGAIGIDDNCTINTLYIDVNNGVNTRIGYRDNSSGPISAGGAIGVVKGAAEDRTFAIQAENNGTIITRGVDEGQGAGGAIGSTDADFAADLYINVVNGTNSQILGLTNKKSEQYGAVGGAIGGMYLSGSISETSIIYVHNSGLIRNRNYAGGVIGFAPVINGHIYAVNTGTVRASETNNTTPTYFAGGAVGCAEGISSTGIVQSVLNGATISGRDFIGGAAGRIHNFNNTALIRTVIRGNSSVVGTGSLVGGICGDIRVSEEGNLGKLELVGDSSNPILTITGLDGVGGVAGLMRFTVDNSVQIVSPNQSATDRLVLHIDGRKSVGGLIGCLRSTNSDNNTTATLLDNNQTAYSIYINMSIVLLPESHIIGTGNNVGGAVGAIDSGESSEFGGSINVSSASGSATSSLASIIKGNKNVGGAVGYIDKSVLTPNGEGSGSIIVNFESRAWTIASTVSVGNEADVGGAIGLLNGTNGKNSDNITYGNGFNGNTYPITVKLGSSTVIAYGYNVGGAIGSSSTRIGEINVTLSGRVEGQYNVGGAIGFNKYSFNSANVTISATGCIEATGSQLNDSNGTNINRRYDNGSNVGGVVGNYSFDANGNATITCSISANISGHVIGIGNNVGGVIGYCYSNKKTHLIQNITANLQGSAVVQGADNVGGVTGFSRSNITNVVSNISGASKVIGVNRVGGAIGWTYADYDGLGDNVLYAKNTNYTNYTLTQLEAEMPNTDNSLFKQSGRINSIIVTISADYALEGRTCIGGAVGQSGWKTVASGNHWASPALISVEVQMNSAYLFDPFDTGVTGGNASVGGVIGLVVDGRVEAVRLSGTGGTVNTDSRYRCPELSEPGAVLIAASGQSVGGIIGQIGLESTSVETLTADNAQKVTVSNITASDNLHLCVVSMDDSNRIGGWVGSAFGKFGGLGNRNANDYQRICAVYNVNNVRCVYSRGDYVGGFCGYSRSYGARETYLVVNVTLDNATVTGRNGVGGAFGMVYAVNFKMGSINVALNNHTVIGDANGSTLCQEAGGAIGSLYQDNSEEGATGNKNVRPDLAIPITVTVDASSHIWSEGGNADTSNYGVGGVLGRAYGKFTASGTLRITATDSNSVTVYSRYSNVGGVVGVMDNVDMSAYTSANTCYASGVSVRSDATDACVGGFVGRINSLQADMLYCYSYGIVTVRANGANACAGGFVGYATWNSDSRKIDKCYTTAEVMSAGEYTGGFVGHMSRGTISNCYVGGHTYQGSYVAGEGNVTGVGYVGGFCGAASGNNNITFDNCYSTASVLGTADGVGGFIGKTSLNTFVNNCYCTGRVTGTNANTTGAFVGIVIATNLDGFTGNKAMKWINPDNFPLIGQNPAESVTGIEYAYSNDIHRQGDKGHPFDSALLPDPSSSQTDFGLRAVIGTNHYGDWPLPVPEGGNIETATILVYAKTGVDPEGHPVYEWVDFENDRYSFEYEVDGVTLDLRVLIQEEELIINDDYILTYRRNDRIGTATVVIAGKVGSGYTGATSRTFRITEADITTADANLTEISHEYTGARIIPTLVVTYNGKRLEINTDYYLAYDRDGDIEHGFDNDNISIGDMYVYVIGMGNYSGTLRCDKKFSITAIDLANLSEDDVELIGADNLVYDEVDGVPVAHCPDVVVRYNGNTLIGTHDPDELGCDYVISYEGNTQAGYAYLVITGTADPTIGTGDVYTGTYKVQFYIAPAVNTWVESHEPEIAGWNYGATPNDPTGKAKFGELTWAFYDDPACSEGHEIDDINNVNQGTYYVKVFVEESDNYTGPIPVILTFVVSPADITNRASVITDREEYPYTGSEITPVITVTVPKLSDLEQIITLVENVDYEVSYTGDRINPGTVTVTVTGIGNYSGTASRQFTIYREYTVTFISNNGGPEPYAVKPVREGDTVTAPDEPSRGDPSSGEIYRFDGWFTDSACTKPYSFDTLVTSDFPLYGGWTRMWTVVFITNGGSEVTTQTVPDGGYLDPVSTERYGYDFAGWYVDSACTNPFDVTYPIIMDNKVYADWTPVTVTVVFYSEGEEVSSDQVTYPNAVDTIVPSVSREGYILDGWCTDAACTEPFDITQPTATNLTLYANWVEDTD